MGDDQALREERTKERSLAVELTDFALNEVGRLDREPDLWERQALAEAIAAIYRGAYRLATTYARDAILPLAERSASAATDPAYLIFDLAQLRKEFLVARTEPLRLFAALGPMLVVKA